MKGKVLKQLWSPMRLSGIRRVDSVTTTKCYKGPRSGNMKAQKAAGTDGLHEVTTFQVDQERAGGQAVQSWPKHLL